MNMERLARSVVEAVGLPLFIWMIAARDHKYPAYFTWVMVALFLARVVYATYLELKENRGQK